MLFQVTFVAEAWKEGACQGVDQQTFFLRCDPAELNDLIKQISKGPAKIMFNKLATRLRYATHFLRYDPPIVIYQEQLSDDECQVLNQAAIALQEKATHDFLDD